MKIWFNFGHSKVLGYSFLTIFELNISHNCLLVHVTPHISQLLHGIQNDNQYEFFNFLSL